MLDGTCFIVHNHHEAFALFHGYLNGLLQTIVRKLRIRFNSHPVDNHLDIMILVAIHFHALFDFLHLSVDTDMQITLTTHALKEFAVVALTTTYQWSQNKNLTTGIVV